MFTEDQIKAAAAKTKSGADYPRLVQDLKRLGVRSYEHFVADGSNIYFDDHAYSVTIAHPQEPIRVAEKSSAEKLRHSLSIHQQGQTSYPEFCIHAGEAGVEKWVSDLEAMTVSYLDKTGKALLVEPIPVAK